MYTLATIIIILISLLIILVVLVQNSKGGGFASGMAMPQQIMGARRSADFLEKLTWGLASGLLLFSLLASLALPRKGEAEGPETELKEKLENRVNVPSLPPSEPAK